MDLNQTKPKRRTRSKTDEKTLRGRSVWIDETGEITGKKGAKYSEVTTTIPFGTQFITAPTIDENGNRLSDDEVKQRLKDNQGKDFITGEKLPVFSSEEKASEYAQWRSNTMFDKEAIEEGFPEETFPDLPEDKKEKSKEGETSLKGFIDYLMSPSRHFGTGQYNKGGAVMNEQMEMAFMQEGGIADDGMDVDPVSGNEVPPGSLAEEVRDDIPAQLSEGEYIVPADVVRYYGVKFFEDLRDQAKMGLADMEANGRIGGEPVPEGGPKNENLTPEEQQAVEAMMGMQQGGAVQNPYLQQQQLYNQEPPKAVGNTMGYATGGSPAPVNQLQTQAITPTVYNQPNYSFLSPSTTTQTSQTTEQAINQATQNVFSPVMMRSPEGVEAEAKTREQMKKWLAAGWVIITAADTPITTDLTGAKVTTGSGPKGSVSDVGGGGSGGTTPTPEKIDYTTYRPDELLEAFDKNRKTRIALTALGAINPMIALFGQGATRAQEKEILAAMEAQGIKPPEDEGGIVDNITDFVSGLFGKDKEEVKNTVVQKSNDKLSPFTQPGYQRKIERERSSGDVSKSTAKEIRKSTKDVTIKGRTDSSGKKAGDVGYESALRKRQSDKRKKYQKTQREKMKAFKKGEQKFGKDSAGNKRNFGGRAEGGLMKKGDK